MANHRGEFMFREREVERTRLALIQGNSVLIVGLRRIGKTWVMKEVAHRLRTEGRVVVWMDVQDLQEPGQFYMDLLDALPKDIREQLLSFMAQGRALPTRLLNWIKGHFSDVSVAGGGAALRKDLADYAAPLARAIETIVVQAEAPPILILDELPFFLENLLQRDYPAEDIRRLLSTLRVWRDQGLPMLIGGSISLEHLLDSIAVPRTVLGGLKPVRVQPFSRDEALQYLQEQASTHARSLLDAAARDLILARIPDHLPFLLKIALDNLHAVVSPTELEHCLDNDCLPEIHRTFSTQVDERLSKRYGEDEQAAARKILDFLCQSGEAALSDLERLPLPHPGKLGDVLAKMQRDDFLLETPQARYRFSLELLRRWWCLRRGMQP